MNLLDKALNGLAERGDPVGSHVLLDRLEHQLTGEPAPVVVALDTTRRAMETTPQPTMDNDAWWRGRRGAIRAFAAAAALIVAVFAITSLINSDSDVADRGPAETIQAYEDAYNAGDIDAVMALFSDTSVISGHKTESSSRGGRSEAVGLSAIRVLLVEDLDHAATDHAYTFSGIVVTGTTVTWDHKWVGNDGNEFCLQGHNAVVEDGRIRSWTWPDDSAGTCP